MNIWNIVKSEIPEMLNNWRVVPRLLLLAYCWAFYETTVWFMNLADPTTAQAGFVSVIVGAGAAWFGLYVGSGKKKS